MPEPTAGTAGCSASSGGPGGLAGGGVDGDGSGGGSIGSGGDSINRNAGDSQLRQRRVRGGGVGDQTPPQADKAFAWTDTRFAVVLVLVLVAVLAAVLVPDVKLRQLAVVGRPRATVAQTPLARRVLQAARALGELRLRRVLLHWRHVRPAPEQRQASHHGWALAIAATRRLARLVALTNLARGASLVAMAWMRQLDCWN